MLHPSLTCDAICLLFRLPSHFSALDFIWALFELIYYLVRNRAHSSRCHQNFLFFPLWKVQVIKKWCTEKFFQLVLSTIITEFLLSIMYFPWNDLLFPESVFLELRMESKSHWKSMTSLWGNCRNEPSDLIFFCFCL